MTFTKENFSWSYADDGNRITFTFKGHAPVYFDATRPRVRQWLRVRHAGGSMHEPIFAFVLAKLIEKIDPAVYFDIGGFLGYFTILPLALMRRQTRIYSFEMNKSSCDLFRDNLALNSHLAPSRVFLVNAGISDQTQLNQAVWVKGFKLLPSGPNGGSNANVDILSLDYIHDGLEISPDLIKMDIEGFEAPALRGAEALLRKKRPVILFELHSAAHLEPHGETRVAVLERLKALGYTVLAVDGLRDRKELNDQPLIRAGSASYDGFVAGENSAFVAMPNEKLDLVSGLIATTS